jgi:hypothetical protein
LGTADGSGYSAGFAGVKSFAGGEVSQLGQAANVLD